MVEEPQVQAVNIEQHILAVADEYGIDREQFLYTAKCESSLDPKVQSYIVKDGVREESYGLFQIHLPSHPYVTIEQATDPLFASKWAAEKFKSGEAYLWTCWRNKYQ